ncbi:hypothetical protein Tco_1336719 [Tanacetum coccineum]
MAENDSIVAEHGLSSKITQSPGRSSDTSEGSENSGSFEDSGRSDEKDFEDEAFSEEGGFGDSIGMKIHQRVQGSSKVLIFVEDSWNEEPCSDVHQVGDEREVEVLRSFNWPPSELITDDGVLPERRKVRAVTLLKGRWFEVYRDYLRRRAVKSSASKWEIVEL